MNSSRTSLTDALRTQVSESPNAPALWTTRSSYISFGEMQRLADDLAQQVRAVTLISDARIAFAVPRGNAAVIGFIAASSVGTVCPLDGKLKQAEYLDALGSLDADVVLTNGTGNSAELAAKSLGIPVLSYEIDFKEQICAVEQRLAATPKQRRRRTDLRFNDQSIPVVLMRTSGTTGQPKIVGLSSANIMSAAQVMKSVFKLVPEDVCLTPMPLNHVHGLIAGALSALLSGSSIHCCESFSPEALDAAMEDYSPTWMTASPAVHLAMRDFYERQARRPKVPRLTRFRSSSAPLAASAIESLETLFNAPLIETYGLTETASTVCSNLLPPGQRKQGSVGIAVDAELAIVNERGKEVTTREVGEIVLKGPGVIQDYLGEAPKDAFLDGRLRTGDMGFLDEDGYLYVVDPEEPLQPA